MVVLGAARGVARTKHQQTPLGGPGGRPWLAPQAGPRKTSLTSSKTTVKDKVVHSMCMGLVVGVLWLGGTPSSFAKTAPPHVLPPFSLVSPIPEPARLFEVASLFSSRPDGDPIEPFVIMGTNMKKYLIEILEGEKIVKRERGFTVETCTSTRRQADERPGESMQNQIGDTGGPGSTCVLSIGKDLPSVCQESCLGSCTETLRAYNAAYKTRTGFNLNEKETGRLLRACSGKCKYECSKAGQVFNFSIPSKSLF